jgi:hypothetical protein
VVQPDGSVVALPLSGLQPSQLYVSEERLARVCAAARRNGLRAAPGGCKA